MRIVLTHLLLFSFALTVGCASNGILRKPNTPPSLAIEEFYYESEPKQGVTEKDYEKNLTRSHQFSGSGFSSDNLRLELITVGAIKAKDYSFVLDKQKKLGKTDDDAAQAVKQEMDKELREFTVNKTCFDFDYVASSFYGKLEGNKTEYWGVKVLNDNKEVPAKLEIGTDGISHVITTTDSYGNQSSHTDWTQFFGKLCTTKALNLKSGIVVELNPRFLKNQSVKRFEWLVKKSESKK